MIWKFAAALVLLSLVIQARADVSEEYREEKTITASIGGGFMVLPVSATAFELGYFVTPDLIVQAAYSDGTFSDDFFGVEASTLQVEAKYFLGNSFYVRGGLGDRQLTLKNVNCTSCGSSGQTIALGTYGYVASLAADVAIGNEWQYKYLAIGCDWIGVMQPLAVLKSQTTASVANSLSASDQSDLNNAWSKVGMTTSFELLHLYLALSF